jgi:hypothetical protein
MKTKILYPGVKNSQTIRIMVNGFGFYTTVKDISNICTTTHRAAVESAMTILASCITKGQKVSGFGSGVAVYNEKLERTTIDTQIDLVD